MYIIHFIYGPYNIIIYDDDGHLQMLRLFYSQYPTGNIYSCLSEDPDATLPCKQ